MLKPRTGIQTAFLVLSAIGQFDPTRFARARAGPACWAAAPRNRYWPPTRRARECFGDPPLRGDLNPAGYVQNPPAPLLSLDALGTFNAASSGLSSTPPVSAVRIRVAGVTGIDPVSRERIWVAAEPNQQQTGLDVDITLAARSSIARSPCPRGR